MKNSKSYVLSIFVIVYVFVLWAAYTTSDGVSGVSSCSKPVAANISEQVAIGLNTLSYVYDVEARTNVILYNLGYVGPIVAIPLTSNVNV